jgi:hypothetical protein
MIQVALCPSEIRRISATDLSQVTAVVFDVLRATSSIITGLASGVEAIIPVRTVEEAREWKLKDPDLLLAGERGGLPPKGFDLGNSPEEFEKLKGRRVVMTTTNGTAAIQSVQKASKVLIGALLNSVWRMRWLPVRWWSGFPTTRDCQIRRSSPAAFTSKWAMICTNGLDKRKTAKRYGKSAKTRTLTGAESSRSSTWYASSKAT